MVGLLDVRGGFVVSLTVLGVTLFVGRDQYWTRRAALATPFAEYKSAASVANALLDELDG